MSPTLTCRGLLRLIGSATLNTPVVAPSSQCIVKNHLANLETARDAPPEIRVSTVLPDCAHADSQTMRSLAGVLLIYALSVLLASTSPVGTGQGVHQFQLVDELMPHVHIVNGQRIEVGGAQPSSATSNPQAGLALGAAAGAAGAIAPGVVLPPSIAHLVIARPAGQRLLAADAEPPVARTEAPPVPPPLVQS